MPRDSHHLQQQQDYAREQLLPLGTQGVMRTRQMEKTHTSFRKPPRSTDKYASSRLQTIHQQPSQRQPLNISAEYQGRHFNQTFDGGSPSQQHTEYRRSVPGSHPREEEEDEMNQHFYQGQFLGDEEEDGEEDEDDEDDAYEAMQHGSPSKRPLEVSLPHISRQGQQ